MPLPGLALVLALAGLAGQGQPGPEAALVQGVQQVEQGDFEGAVITLDAARQALAAQPGREPHLVQAQVYLAVAYVALEQRERARQAFLEALAVDERLQLGAGQFSPKVRAVFEEARRQHAAAKGTRPRSARRPVLAAAGVAVAAGGVVLATRTPAAAAPMVPDTPGASAGNARFATPSIECDDDSFETTLPFALLLDVTAPAGTTLRITTATVEMTVASSPGVPLEVGFLSSRPTRTVPDAVVAGTTATLRLESSLLCTNAAGGPAREQEWTARTTLVTSLGTLAATSADRLRVTLP